MRVLDRGDGRAEIAVVCGIHGDEPGGVQAARRLVNEHNFDEPVRFIVANEEALAVGERFLDADLTRSFPGPRDSRAHEISLAPRVLEAIGDRWVVDLHSTMSRPTPFVILGDLNSTSKRLARLSGLDHAVHHEHLGGGLVGHLPGVTLEGGPMGTDQAAEELYESTRNVLAGLDALEAPAEPSDPRVYRVYERLIPPAPDAYTNLRNFSPVREGDTVAENRSNEFASTDHFVPVLVSNDGYRDILGFKATEEGWLSTYPHEH